MPYLPQHFIHKQALKMAILTIVLGVVFVLLMLSLLATTIMELVAAFMKLRGKNLKKALTNMLVGMEKDGVIDDNSILKKFMDNPLYKQLCYQYSKGSTDPPSYISPNSFQTILFDVLLDGKELKNSEVMNKISELKNEDLRRILTQFLREADGNIEIFKSKVEGWFNSVMERSTGWYKRMTQKIIIIVGIGIAVVLNADTLSMYERLESNPTSLEQVVLMAESFAGKNDSVDGIVETNLEFEQAKDQLNEFIVDEIESLKSPLGLGWKNVNMKDTPYNWAVKILGWIITALAISLGAPFWFDILKKLVNIRSSGTKP